MLNINKEIDNFSKNLGAIDEINKFGDTLTDLTITLLEDLRQQNEEYNGFIPYKQKLDNVIEQIKGIKHTDPLKKKYEIIFNQSIVLIISSFEIFLGEFIINISNNFPEIINWKEKEKIPIDPKDYNYASLNYGQIVLKYLKQKYSLQDIQSIKRLLEEYFYVEKSMEESLDELIFYQAARNVIVHNLAKVDESFIRQIQKTKYRERYSSSGHKLELRKKDYDNVKKIYTKVVKNIKDEIYEYVEDKYGSELIIK